MTMKTAAYTEDIQNAIDAHVTMQHAEAQPLNPDPNEYPKCESPGCEAAGFLFVPHGPCPEDWMDGVHACDSHRMWAITTVRRNSGNDCVIELDRTEEVEAYRKELSSERESLKACRDRIEELESDNKKQREVLSVRLKRLENLNADCKRLKEDLKNSGAVNCLRLRERIAEFGFNEGSMKEQIGKLEAEVEKFKTLAVTWRKRVDPLECEIERLKAIIDHIVNPDDDHD